MSDLNHQLVAALVITYNSSNTILETLESIKAQTYPNIELIISDDCSTDDTIDICHKWIAENGSRFARTEIIESPTNTGIAANCNRAEDACRAKWVKLLAGDDLLLPECIDTYMHYVAGRDDLPCLFSRVQCFSAIDGKDVNDFAAFDYRFFSLSREQQLHHLLYEGNCIPAATVFINLSLMRQLGIRNDERIPMLEDLPKWINVLNAGYRLEFLDRKLVRYRVFNGISTVEASPSFYYSGLLYTLLYQYPEWKKRDPNDAYRRLRECMGDAKPPLGIRDRRSLRVGRFILSPVYQAKDIIKRIKRRK